MTLQCTGRPRPLLILVLLMLCGAVSAGGDAPVDAAQLQYDQNSWRDIIADDCRAFTDGCNNCVRGSENSAVAACTRMACLEYQKPRCLDKEAKTGPGEARPASKTIEYACDGGNTFSVVYHEYIQDDQRVRLTDSEIMFRDHQTHTVYRLQRQRSASGEQYSDAAGFMFFAKGDEAMVNQQQARLYRNCAIKQ